MVTLPRCFGLAIGFAFLGSAYACGHVSGAALNPAVALPLGLGGGKDGRADGRNRGKGWVSWEKCWKNAGTWWKMVVFPGKHAGT